MNRTLALSGLTLAVCALACAQENSGNRVVIPARNGSRPRVVEATVIHGSITVKASSGSEIIAEVPGTSRRVDRNVPPGMHRIDSPWRGGIQVSESGDVVRIVGPESEGDGMLLTVPTNTSLRLRSTHGDLSITGVHGEIDVASTHGDVVLTGVSGTVLANSVHGSITASMNQVDQAKPISFITLNGNIEVTLPADVRMNLKLKADRGEIWSDFDVKLAGGGAITQPSGRTTGRYRVLVDRTLRGTVNGGGVDATFSTLNGRITIHKK